MFKLSARPVAVLLFVFLLIPDSFSQGPATTKKSSAEDPSEQPAIIQELSTTARYENDGSNVQTVRQRVKIQNEAGVRLYGIITFNFIAGQEFSIDTVEVHKKDGSTIKAPVANALEVTPEISRVAPMYSDIHQKQVTVPGLSVGDEVVFQYTARQTALVPNQFWSQYSFAKSLIVLSETVQIDVPKDRKLHLKFQPEYKPEIKTNGDRTLYQWHAVNEKIQEKQKTALATERLTGTAPPPSIELSTFENWDQVGAWYYGLQRERSTPTPEIKAKALELTKGLESDEARIKALYQFVSLNFRYIGLDFGIGRYQPHPAAEVLGNNYGDCKDKHTLLAALLEAVGIHSYPVLISSERVVDPDVPSPGQFDHLITALPQGKGVIFLDTTAELAPYGMLISSLRHKKSLVITGPASAQFIETPADLPFPAQELFDLKGKIDESGTLEAEVDYYIRGDAEIILKNAFRQAAPSKQKDIVQGISYYAGFAGDVSQVKVEGVEDLNTGLHITYHYHRPEYLEMKDDGARNTLPLSFSRFPKWEDEEDSVRLYPSTGELISRCRVELPAGVTIVPPLEVKLDRDYLRYQSSYSAQKNVVTGERKITILSGEVRGDHRHDYAAFLKSEETDEGQKLAIHLPEGFVAKSSITASADIDELARRAEIELRERSYTDAYADFHKIAEQDPKRKGIWTQIGRVEALLGRREDSIRDYQKAITADPFDASAHIELGAVYFTTQRPDAGIEELKKALEIDPLNHRAHFLLGWHYSAVAHDSASAVPELEKALSTKEDGVDDEVLIRRILTPAYFELKQFDKGVESIKRTVESSPTPSTWNDAAYELAENNQSLDLAQQYADLALKGIYERLNQLEPGSIRLVDFVLAAQLSMTWDTMGWIHFKAGHPDLAEKYIHAAWIISQNRESAEHLGEIYESLKQPQEALRFYAMSVNPDYRAASRKPDKGRSYLVKTMGKLRAEQFIRNKAAEPSQMRTINLGNIAPAGTTGQYYFVFAPGPKLIGIQPVGGDSGLADHLRKLENKIAATVIFPENAPQKLIREGFVMCSAYEKSCKLVFNTSDMPTANAIPRVSN